MMKPNLPQVIAVKTHYHNIQVAWAVRNISVILNVLSHSLPV